MKLSIIILNYNVRYFLELCLRSVIKATENIESEIIVLDNASTDDSNIMVEELFPQITLIKNKVNVGFAKANNQGVALAKGQFICILNPDTVVPEDLFTNLINFSDSKVNLGIVGCKLIDGSGRFLPESKRNIPTPKVSFKKIFGNVSSYYATHIQRDETDEVQILVGALMFMKKSVFEDVNGFDEDYFMYAEDVDISYKILKKRYKNYYLGTNTVIHFKGESTVKDSKYLKRFYGSMQIFYKKHFRNRVFLDAIVWLGIRVMPIFKGDRTIHKKKIETQVYISSSADKLSLTKTGVTITNQSDIKSIIDNTSYIFDIDSFSYKSIINSISTSGGLKNVSFKFFVPKSNFIIGSDSCDGRGEVLKV